jgi:hypothetical protein
MYEKIDTKDITDVMPDSVTLAINGTNVDAHVYSWKDTAVYEQVKAKATATTNWGQTPHLLAEFFAFPFA